MTTQKLTPAQKKVVNFLTEGNQIMYHNYERDFQGDGGAKFSYKVISKLIEVGTLKIKENSVANRSFTYKTIVLA